MSNKYMVAIILCFGVFSQGCFVQSSGTNNDNVEVNSPERDYTYPTPVEETPSPNSDFGPAKSKNPVSDPPMNDEGEELEIPSLKEFKEFLNPIPPRPADKNKKVAE